MGSQRQRQIVVELRVDAERRMVVEIVRSRIERSLLERSAGSERSTRYRVVPLERLGLHFETRDDDDATKRSDDAALDCKFVWNKFEKRIIFFFFDW